MTEHIQINDVAPRVQYMADGVQSAFTFPFAIFADTDLEVWLDDALQSGGYSVSGAGISTGGTALFVVAPAGGVRVTLRRRLPIRRTTDYQADGLIRAKTLNDEMDYQVAALQQVAEVTERSLRRSATSSSLADLTLPEPAANRSLKWNAAGTGLVNSTNDPDAVGDATLAAQQAITAAQTAVAASAQATSAAASLNNPLSATANLSDLDDTATARGNLGVPALADIAVDARTAKTGIALDDMALVHDSLAGADRKVSIGNLLKAVNLLDTDATPDKAADYVMTWDASAGEVKKVPLSGIGGGWEVASITDFGSGNTFMATTIDITGLDTSQFEYAIDLEELMHSKAYPHTDTIYVQVGTGSSPTWVSSYRVHALKTSPNYTTSTFVGGNGLSGVQIDGGSDKAYRSIQHGRLCLAPTLPFADGSWFPGYLSYQGAYHTYSGGEPNFMDVKATWSGSGPVTALKFYTGSGGGFYSWGRIRVSRRRITA
ncbi:MAG: hypothetical protein LDL39_11225 [Magnetospirillum sp.]|nr:hypothetical protein [Magnetospirillum sp.]